jgi:hypothetical protein
MLPLKVSMVNFCRIGLKEEHDPTARNSSQIRQGAQIRGQSIGIPIVG